jgi:hypothetical protein
MFDAGLLIESTIVSIYRKSKYLRDLSQSIRMEAPQLEALLTPFFGAFHRAHCVSTRSYI